MDLLPSDFNPGLVCEQRAQVELPELTGCISLYWNPQTNKGVAEVLEFMLEFQDPNISILEALTLLGYPVPHVRMRMGPLDAEDFLNSSLRDLSISQATLTGKTQSVEVVQLLNMLRKYEETGCADLRQDIVLLADGVLMRSNGTCWWQHHEIFADQGFPVCEMKAGWAEMGIFTRRGIIVV